MPFPHKYDLDYHSWQFSYYQSIYMSLIIRLQMCTLVTERWWLELTHRFKFNKRYFLKYLKLIYFLFYNWLVEILYQSNFLGLLWHLWNHIMAGAVENRHIIQTAMKGDIMLTSDWPKITWKSPLKGWHEKCVPA